MRDDRFMHITAGGRRRLLGRRIRCAGLLFISIGLGACGGERVGVAGEDSVTELAPGRGRFQPVAQLAAERIDECSGIAWLDSAYFVHNDSGDQAVLYRSRTLDFADPEVLPLEGAAAVDWVDITVYEGDLLIGDIGDNRRERDHLVLYRARYSPPPKGIPPGAGERGAQVPPEGSAAVGTLALTAAYVWHPDSWGVPLRHPGTAVARGRRAPLLRCRCGNHHAPLPVG